MEYNDIIAASFAICTCLLYNGSSLSFAACSVSFGMAAFLAGLMTTCFESRWNGRVGCLTAAGYCVSFKASGLTKTYFVLLFFFASNADLMSFFLFVEDSAWGALTLLMTCPDPALILSVTVATALLLSVLTIDLLRIELSTFLPLCINSLT